MGNPRIRVSKAPMAGLAALLLTASAGSAAAEFTRSPWIQDATSDSATIAWEAGTAGGVQRLVYGEGASMDLQVDGVLLSDRFYTATVTGLQPSKAFSYRVVSGQDESPAGSFVTAPATAEPFRFGVTGDNRSDPSGHASVVAATLPFAPDFMLNTGDIVDGTDYREFFEVEAELLRNAVIFPAPGNHDSPSQYQYGFARPNYYSFRWGNAFFISINTDGDYASGSDQVAWVEQELQGAAADETVDWIFAYHHHPVWSSGSHGSTGQAIDVLNPLYMQYGVDVVFNGHDHNFERIERDGILYVVTGGGGVNPRSMGSAVEGQKFAESVRHVTIVDLDGGVLELKAYRPDGSLIDERLVEKGPRSETPEEPGNDPGPGPGPGPGPADPADADSMETIHGGCACDVAASPRSAGMAGSFLLALGLAGLLVRRRSVTG